jgi:hypothetical protein
MFEIAETNIDTAGQGARKVCITFVNGCPPLEKEGQGGFADVCSNQEYTDPSQLPFFREGAGSSEKMESLRGCHRVAQRRPHGIELAKGVLASLFVVISSLRDKSHRYDAMWARIAMRVAGSWIAASGLFMLGGAGELKWF